MTSWFTTDGDPATVLFDFIRVEGTPTLAYVKSKYIEREGVPDFGVKFEAARADPYKLKTFRDVVDVAAADVLAAAYLAVQRIELRLFWQGRFWHRVYVERVVPQALEVGKVGAGGFVDGAVMLPVEWTLRGVQ